MVYNMKYEGRNNNCTSKKKESLNTNQWLSNFFGNISEIYDHVNTILIECVFRFFLRFLQNLLFFESNEKINNHK